jgi:hypothetical protein
MMQFTGWKGLTKDNQLASIYQRAPQPVADFMVQLLALYRGKSLESELAKYPTKEFDTDDEFMWQVLGSSRRNIPLLEARYEDGTVVDGTNKSGENAGIGTTPFYLVFGEDWFADGEVLFGNLNEVYPMRVLGDPRMEGTNAVYKVELMGAVTEGIPVERLQQGERFSHEFAPVERELSRKVGDLRFTAPVTVRNEWTTLRKQYKVPGSTMLNKKLVCGVPVVDKNGNKKVQTMWMPWVEWQFEQEWSDEKNSALMFGTSNRNSNGEYHNIGKSGEVIRMGDGLLAQMKYGNTYYYNDFSLKMLEDALYELSAAKLDFGDRTFVIRTGEQGAILFHNAVRNSLSGWQEFQINADQLGMLTKTNSPLHKNSMAATGMQFTEFSAPNGVTVKLEVDSFYDDPVRNKVLDSNGHPLMSSRFDIMYIGTTDQPNIFKCAIKGNPEFRGFQWGPFANPFTGEANNTSASFDEDAAVMHRKTTLGVCILDPTRTMSLIPAALEG